MTRNNGCKTPRKNTPTDCVKDPIEVFCRVRPLPENEESCVEILNDKVLQMTAPKYQKSVQSRVEQVQCTFSKIFPQDVTQKQMFENVGLPLVQDLLRGKNGLCFMYGITGSGKTYTMNGDESNSGVLPRCLDCIFNSINDLQTARCVFKPDGYNGFRILGDEDAKVEAKSKHSEMQAMLNKLQSDPRCSDDTTLKVEEDNNYAVFISFVEIYNNSAFDLLEDIVYDKLGQPKSPCSKILREDKRGNIFVYEASEIEVKSTDEAFTLFRMGQDRRKTAHTLLNTESSRSHCVLTLKLVQVPLNPSGETIIKDINMIGISQLSLCDLAGSERISRTKNEGEKMRQAGHINNSLMTLRSCIEALRENQKNPSVNKMIPYRESKLTHLFRNYFDGDGKLRMVVCLNPNADDFDESLHVMKFSEVTQEVKIARSEGVKFDLGLTPGRGKINARLKAMRNEVIVSSDMGSEESLIPTLQLFSPWPLLEIAGYNDNTTLPNLIHALEERIKLRETLNVDLKHKQMEVRQMILQLEQDNIDLTKALEEQRGLLSDKKKESKLYEERIRVLNEKCETLQRSSQSYESEKRQLSIELEKVKESVNEEKQKRLKLKRTHKDITSTERLKWEKECEKRVHAKQLEMEGQVMIKVEKLNQLRGVVDDLRIPEKTQIRLNQIISRENKENIQTTCQNAQQEKCQSCDLCSHKSPQVRVTCQHKCQSSDQNHCEHKSIQVKKQQQCQHEKYQSGDSNSEHKTPDVKKAKKPPVHPKPHANTTPRKRKKVRSRSPPAAIGRKYDMAPIRGKHRRSRSTDFWLEHKPADTLNTNNLMQPCIPNKKTVKSPSVKDLKVIPNYILNHQEEDSAGEIETQLIKGEVHETRGGGSCVKFTEIETLKRTLQERVTPQTSTNNSESESSRKVSKSSKNPSKDGSKSSSKKRKSLEEDTPQSTDIEARCSAGIEAKKGCAPGIKHKKLKS